MTFGFFPDRLRPRTALACGVFVCALSGDRGAGKKVFGMETSAPHLNDVATTVALVNANAIIGVVAKDSNGDGRIDIMNGKEC